MSVEQLESAIRDLSIEERHRLVSWLDSRRHELLMPEASSTSDLAEDQLAELRRRRQEYRDHPERFIPMSEKSLEEMFARIRHACAGVSSAH